MPATISATGIATLSCTSCGTTVETSGVYDGRPMREAYALGTSTRVTETFGWDAYAGGRDENGRRRGRFHSWCRACQRARRGTGTTRTRTARVPGTTAAARAAVNRRAFGVEIECYLTGGVRAGNEIVRALRAAGTIGAWKCVSDGSLTYGQGVEFVSPKLRGEQGRQQVRAICSALQAAGATVNKSCGTHVHHDANDLDVDAIKRLVTGWHNAQPMLDGIVAPSRRGGNTYCRHLDSRDLDRVNACGTIREVQSFYRNHYQADRYRTLNYAQYGRRGTVEARQHQGTLDADKIIAYLDLGQAIIAEAIEGRTVTAASRFTDFVASLTRLPEAAGLYLIGRAAHFNAVSV